VLASAGADAADVAAVMAGIVQGRDAALLNRLQQLAEDGQRSAESRAAVLERLAAVRPAVVAKLAAGLLSELQNPLVAATATRALLNEKAGPKLLADALAERELRNDVALEVLRVLRESGRTDAELDAALKKAGRIAARKTLTDEQKAGILKTAMTEAKATDGERIFRTESLGCLKCHAVGAAGGLVGPDMISLGASAQPDYLLESLLNPNAKVKENYHTTVVATVEGQVIAGVQIQRSDKAITLRTAENRVVVVPADQIEEVGQGVSLMPEGLVDALTDKEIAALVRFLSELGRTPEYTLSRRRFARTWQVLLPTPEGMHQINRTSFSKVAASDPAFTFVPRYAVVGGVLPLEDVPAMQLRGQSVGFAQTQLNVTTPGEIAFRLNSAAGVEVRIDGVPMPAAAEFSTVLGAGGHTVTVTIDRGQRSEPLQLELLDSSKQPAGNAELLN